MNNKIKKRKKSEIQKLTSNRGMIKVSGIIHRRENKSDTRLAWIIPQNIFLMYCNTNNKEEWNSVILLTSMSENIEANKQNNKVEDSQGNMENNQPLIKTSAPPLTSTRFEQESRRYGNVMKLVYISMEGGTGSYVITSYLNMK